MQKNGIDISTCKLFAISILLAVFKYPVLYFGVYTDNDALLKIQFSKPFAKKSAMRSFQAFSSVFKRFKHRSQTWSNGNWA